MDIRLGTKTSLRSIYHFFRLPEIRLFNHFQITPHSITFPPQGVKFHFDKQHQLVQPQASAGVCLKKHKKDYVYLTDGVILKGHFYRTLARRLKISFALPRISNLIKQKGLGEAIHHHIAFTRLHGKTSLRIPKILSIQSLKKFGLVYEHQLEVEYIDNTKNFAEHLTSSSANKETTFRLLLQLKQSFLLMAEQGILHLDLRPENIIIDSDGNLYIIDWEYACLSKSVCPTAYSNFSFASMLFMLRAVQNPSPEILEELISSIKHLLGPEFQHDVFYGQYQQGLGKQKAHDQLINTYSYAS